MLPFGTILELNIGNDLTVDVPLSPHVTVNHVEEQFLDLTLEKRNKSI